MTEKSGMNGIWRKIVSVALCLCLLTGITGCAGR